MPLTTAASSESQSPAPSGTPACFGSKDLFCSSDLEVCLFGIVAPCVLYGSNAERARTESCSWHLCQPLSCLYCYEVLDRSCGCCGSCVEDDYRRGQCDSACDLATHVFCHVCALCQGGRELRRRVPHPGFNAQPVFVMLPPGEQTIGRGGV